MPAKLRREAIEKVSGPMVSASKILTVSYGTFSCTLEGFDEPFSTMKAIAEYFRDLAAADRYFWAEPPTPDAEMLHRIAEREIQRRVEAKIGEHGIVLRQTSAAEEPAEQPAAPVAAEAPVPLDAPLVVSEAARPRITDETEAETVDEAAVTEAAVTEAAVTEVPAVEVPVAEIAAAGMYSAAEDDSVAAKLMRIRAAVAASRVAPVAAVALAAEDEAEDEAAPTADAEESAMIEDFGFEIDLPDLHRAVAAEEVAEEIAEEIAANAEVVALDATLTDEAAEAAVEDEDAAVIPEAAAEDDAEPEALEIAVVEAAVEDVAEEAALTDDANFDEIIAAATDVETDVAATAEAAVEATVMEDDDAQDALAVIGSLEADAEVLADEADELEVAVAEESAADRLPEAVAEEADIETNAEAVAVAELMAAVGAAPAPAPFVLGAESRADVTAPEHSVPKHNVPEHSADADAFGDEWVEALAEDLGEETVAVAEADAAEEDDAAILAMIEATEPAAEAPVAEVLADVTEDHALVDDEMADDDVAEADVLPMAAAPVVKQGFLSRARARVIKVRKSLTAEGHDDVAEPAVADMHAAEAGTQIDDELVAALSDDDADTAEDASGRGAILAASSAADEAALSRLMEEATSKLEGAENRRRFSAISHLKAAVAATVADRKLKPQDAHVAPADEGEDEIDLYRDDLSKAVRPRRPASEGAQTRRPSIDTRPTPLVLVSEQRVDRPSDIRSVDTVIRPRRISSGNLALTDDDDILDADADVTLSAEEVQSFAEFAERLGVSSLTELLEAAAAYTSSVEGRVHFSRPQILRRVAYVADDGDFQSFDLLFMLADRHCVEQCLRRMLICSVTGVDNRGTADFCQLMRHTSRAVANDDAIRLHSV